jgi:MtfA peptidase
MNYSLSLFYIVAAMGFLAFGIYYLFLLQKRRRLKKLLEQPFATQSLEVLKNMPLYGQLDAKDRQKIQQSIEIFIYEKEFIGIGIEMTDEIKTVIAFHACLLLLHVELKECYGNLTTILVYPHTVIAKHLSASGGIFSQGEFLLEGQSASGTVIISWDHAKKDAYHCYENNVILHEFAHELDFLDGRADGTPPMPSAKYQEWAKTLSTEFHRLSSVVLKNRDWGKYKLIGSYAATNEAEFFAVITERYFEKPTSLKKHFPELFAELDAFYKFYGED